MAVSLFDAYRLNTCFPRKIYESKTPMYFKFTVHFLIALDQPVATIAAYAAKHLDQLHNHSGEDKLTPMHVAAIKGKVDVATALLDLGALVDAEDAHGWTPFHHSALLANRVAMQDLLKSRGANPDKKTTMGITADDIVGYVDASLRKCWSLPHLFYYTPSGELNRVTDASRELGMQGYTDLLVFPEEALGILWRAKRIPDAHIGVGRLVEQMKKELEEHPPQLIITEELERLDGGASRGLCTKESIEAGDCIGIFSGRIAMNVESKEFHQLVLEGTGHPQPLFECEDSCGIVDDQETNALRFINDGNPNCAIDFSTTLERLLIAAQKLQPGDPIYMDYGLRRVDLKWGHYRILDAKGLEESFRQQPETMWKSIRASGQALAEMSSADLKLFKMKYVHNLFYGVKLRYAFQTPAALIYLWAKEVVKPGSWLNLLGNNDLRDQLIMFKAHQNHYTWVIKLLEFMEGLDKRLPKPMPLRQEVLNFVLEQMQHLTVTQVMKLIASVVEYIDSGSELERVLAEVERLGTGTVKKARVIDEEMQAYLRAEGRSKDQILERLSEELTDAKAEEEGLDEELFDSAKKLKDQMPFENTWPILRENLRGTLPTYRWDTEKKSIFKGVVVIPDGDEKARDIARKLGLIV